MCTWGPISWNIRRCDFESMAMVKVLKGRNVLNRQRIKSSDLKDMGISFICRYLCDLGYPYLSKQRLGGRDFGMKITSRLLVTTKICGSRKWWATYSPSYWRKISSRGFSILPSNTELKSKSFMFDSIFSPLLIFHLLKYV